MLSSSGLAISITMIRFVIELDSATNTVFLYLSWSFFAIAIISTIASYLTGQRAINDWILYAEKYYLLDDNSYEEKIPLWSKLNDIVNFLSSLFFMLGVIFIVIFTMINVAEKGEISMSENKSNKEKVQESANIPVMKKKSAEIPKPVKKPIPNNEKK